MYLEPIKPGHESLRFSWFIGSGRNTDHLSLFGSRGDNRRGDHKNYYIVIGKANYGIWDSGDGYLSSYRFSGTKAFFW